MKLGSKGRIVEVPGQHDGNVTPRAAISNCVLDHRATLEPYNHHQHLTFLGGLVCQISVNVSFYCGKPAKRGLVLKT